MGIQQYGKIYDTDSEGNEITGRVFGISEYGLTGVSGIIEMIGNKYRFLTEDLKEITAYIIKDPIRAENFNLLYKTLGIESFKGLLNYKLDVLKSVLDDNNKTERLAILLMKINDTRKFSYYFSEKTNLLDYILTHNIDNFALLYNSIDDILLKDLDRGIIYREEILKDMDLLINIDKLNNFISLGKKIGKKIFKLLLVKEKLLNTLLSDKNELNNFLEMKNNLGNEETIKYLENYLDI